MKRRFFSLRQISLAWNSIGTIQTHHHRQVNSRLHTALLLWLQKKSFIWKKIVTLVVSPEKKQNNVMDISTDLRTLNSSTRKISRKEPGNITVDLIFLIFHSFPFFPRRSSASLKKAYAGFTLHRVTWSVRSLLSQGLPHSFAPRCSQPHNENANIQYKCKFYKMPKICAYIPSTLCSHREQDSIINSF